MPANTFHRHSAGPRVVYVTKGVAKETDLVAPSRVIDLRLSTLNNNSQYVELEWTAPGDDLDSGKGEIKIYSYS